MNAQRLREFSPALPASRKDVVVETLRKSILSGGLRAGHRLNLDEIAIELNVSRMPVREALKQLESEGLVTIFPHRGVAVSELSARDVEEIFGIRIVLEQKAAELAIPRLGREDLAEMEALLGRMDQSGSHGPKWIKLNEKFHHTINSASGWPRLVSMIEIQRVNVERYVRAYVRMQGYERPQEQHWSLFRACCDRDVEKAKAVIGEHFRDTADRLITELREAETRREEIARSGSSDDDPATMEA
ncbi:MAG: GntR family transcriptional regulator [Hyphomicrobiales bacterium]|nr:GntR family transcriptional regulator [Hyphomicrobiales bacterium]